MGDDYLGVALAAPPRDGEANAELVDFVRTFFGLKKSDVSFASGGKSREKLVSLGSVSIEHIEKTVNDALK